MKVVSAFAAAALALFGAAQAVDIDNGFTQDGSTTYCMGVSSTNGSVGTLSFNTLEASNVGRCPVGVTLSLTASEFHASDPVSVKWTAKATSGLTNSIFPNAIDSTTGLPGAVTSSSLFACTYGTNCATNVGGTPTGADGTSSGAFSTDGSKALETNTFTLATAGDYIIVGLVALPGDASLSLSAEEFIVFKKISIVSADTVISSTSGSSSTGSVGTSEASGSGPSTTAPPVTTAPPLTSAPSSSTGSSSAGSTSSSLTSASGSTSGSGNSGSTAEQGSKSTSGSNESNGVSDSSAKKTTSAPTTSDGSTDQKNAGSSDSTKSASTSSGSGSFLENNGVIIIAALVGCCIVGVVGFAFVMRRRKEQRVNANKAFDLHSPSMASDMDDSGLGGHNGGKIDLTYIANISARNNNKAAENMMSEESSVAIMASAERGSELNSSNGSSLHSLPKSSLDTDEYSEKASYGAAGAAAHSNEAEIDSYRMSNMSELSSVAGGTQSEASSMSNFGDSVVSARQNKYLQPGDWNDSESSRMDSRLDSMEQAELKARGFGSIGGFSTVSGFSEDNTSRITGLSDHDSNRDIGFSMSSRPTVESRFTEDYPVTADRATVESRFTEDYRATEESRATEDSRATGFSEAMDQSRLQSEVSVDSYGFRASRSSADSYSSGMSPYSRESSRISGFSVDSSVDRSSNDSKY
ncbi:hypothetical protein PHYPSEUDO_005987 [Phytophthora pseudosyringae]|uniref:Uncharacterized protein n=1 Tax=Phytophthora pseudosyringae TaxID=221518 RepID=A0A8T1VPZ6_9STRA|nr:hypothetical protein PHYPSEUDO_005987 [Phytophthora pseudosyringae]